MQEIRCKKCGKLLGYIDGKYEIKCPRCGAMNAEKESVNNERNISKFM
jgi:LSD1 subclass zinc finger protein